MICSICSERYALAEPITDKSGLQRPMCVQCAAKNSKPKRFPRGTQNGSRRPQNDFADDERAQLGRELEVQSARAEQLARLLTEMMRMFPELRTSLSTAPQQALLREVRAVLVEVGK